MQANNSPSEIQKAIKKLRDNLEFLQRQKEPNQKKINALYFIVIAVEAYYNENESFVGSFKEEYEALQTEFSDYKIKMEEMKTKFEMICFIHGIFDIENQMDFSCSKSLAERMKFNNKYKEIEMPLALRLSPYITITSTAPAHSIPSPSIPPRQ